jgi:hypothetical protein
MDDSEYLEIKERAWERLSAIPGVHAVGLGTRVVAGSRTSETAIVVLDELDAAELVPSTMTDVVEMSERAYCTEERKASKRVGNDSSREVYSVDMRYSAGRPNDDKEVQCRPSIRASKLAV